MPSSFGPPFATQIISVACSDIEGRVGGPEFDLRCLHQGAGTDELTPPSGMCLHGSFCTATGGGRGFRVSSDLSEHASSQTLDPDIKYVYEARNIFHAALAKILEVEGKPLTDRITRCPTDIDSTGWGNAFQSRGNIDPVAQHVFTFAEHVTKIDADPQI
jgi:hypothetical protein